jgi:hypothetical protein
VICSFPRIVIQFSAVLASIFVAWGSLAREKFLGKKLGLEKVAWGTRDTCVRCLRRRCGCYSICVRRIASSPLIQSFECWHIFELPLTFFLSAATVSVITAICFWHSGVMYEWCNGYMLKIPCLILKYVPRYQLLAGVNCVPLMVVG